MSSRLILALSAGGTMTKFGKQETLLSAGINRLDPPFTSVVRGISQTTNDKLRNYVYYHSEVSN